MTVRIKVDEPRGHVRNLFVITGPPGSGKTPILHELIRRGFIGVNEPARDIIGEQRAVGGNAVYEKDPQLFCDLMLARSISDHQRMVGTGVPVWFDRGVPDMVGYAELFGLNTIEAEAAAQRYRYEAVVFALPSWPEIYVTDGERQMSFESARAFGDRVRNVYVDLGYTIVEVPCDSVAARATFIAENVQG